MFIVIVDPSEVEILKSFIAFGAKPVTYAIQLSSGPWLINDVIFIGSDCCSVGGDRKLSIEKLNTELTLTPNKLVTLTNVPLELPHRILDNTFYL